MKDLVDAVTTRVKTPLFGYFLISFIAFNWQSLFFLFVDISSVESRIDYFEENTNLLTLLLYPFGSAVAYSIAYHWINYALLKISAEPTRRKNALQADVESALIIKKLELEQARNSLQAEREKALIDEAKRDQEVSNIGNEKIKKKVESDISKIRNESDEGWSLDDLTTDEKNILILILEGGPELSESDIKRDLDSANEKITYFLNKLEKGGYVGVSYYGGYSYYDLTDKSRKMLIDAGIL